MNWNPEKLSQLFISQAGEAERYMKEVKSKISRTDNYKPIFDEHLAKFYVYNYLHGRTFLESRELLLNELKHMLSYEIKPPDCYDLVNFERYRKFYINQLIAEYSK